MIQFGVRKLDHIYVHDEKNYHHIIFYLGLGSQYGMGECVTEEEGVEGIMNLEKFIADQLRRYVYNGPERFWHFLHHLIPLYPQVIRAMDMASWDLWSKLNGKSVEQSMHGNAANSRAIRVCLYPSGRALLWKPGTPAEMTGLSGAEQYVILPDAVSDKDGLRSVIPRYPATTFLLNDPALLSEFPNTQSFKHFENTQGISDIKIHSSTQEERFYVSDSGSFITLSLLHSLCPDGSIIFVNKNFLRNEVGYKNVNIGVDGLPEFNQTSYSGHGISL